MMLSNFITKEYRSIQSTSEGHHLSGGSILPTLVPTLADFENFTDCSLKVPICQSVSQSRWEGGCLMFLKYLQTFVNCSGAKALSERSYHQYN